MSSAEQACGIQSGVKYDLQHADILIKTRDYENNLTLTTSAK